MEDFFEENYDFEPRAPKAPNAGFLGGRLWLFGRRTHAEETRERLAQLDAAIKQYPDAYTNYVLRGELLSEQEDYEAALADFCVALELAAAQFETDDWGILSQALRDRAEVGLERARQLLDKKH